MTRTLTDLAEYRKHADETVLPGKTLDHVDAGWKVQAKVILFNPYLTLASSLS